MRGLEAGKYGIPEVQNPGKMLHPDFVTSYRQLRVFQKSYALAMEIHKTSLHFPKIEQYALADQLRRSSKSVCANIAEGFPRQKSSRLEWKRFLLIAIASGEESKCG